MLGAPKASTFGLPKMDGRKDELPEAGPAEILLESWALEPAVYCLSNFYSFKSVACCR